VRYLDNNLPRITISVGVASFPEAGDNPQSVLKAADDALYRAKEGGRNRVELAAEGLKPTRAKPTVATDGGKFAAD
jgi:diguanylate cyclase (GGDEF)-like protein